MAILWTPDLAIGHTAIDRQHEELFFRVDRLLTACRRGECRQEVQRMLDFLASYAEKHFADEERLMASHHYPRLKEHVAEHRRFRERLQGMETQLTEVGPQASLVASLQLLVVDWLRDHISKRDRAFGDFLKQ